MSDNLQGIEPGSTVPANVPEYVSPVAEHGEILRLSRRPLGDTNASAIWPLAPGDDSVLNEYRNYARQTAAIAYELDGEAARIAADPNLSDPGKEAALRAAAESALNRTALIAEKVEKFGDKVRSQISEPLPATKPYDALRPWEWAQDFELVRMLRGMPAPERGRIMVGLRNGENHRIADAVLRSGPELSGIQSAQFAEIKRAAQERLSPEPYARRDAIERSQAAIANVIRKAVGRISTPGRNVVVKSSFLGERARFFPL